MPMPMRLPAPLCPRRHRVISRQRRASNLRKALQFGPLTLASARQRMCCSRSALHHTLKLMPDITLADGTIFLARVASSCSRQAVAS